MKVLFLALLLTACVTPKHVYSSNQLSNIESQLYTIESQNEAMKREQDIRSYRADMARCGKSQQCRVNTKFLWKRILEDESL